jgi:hypothetical protein
MGMMGGYGMGGGGDVGNFWKSEEKRVQIRGLDFTAQPDTTYKYRVRIVVFNPNYHRDDISPEAGKLKDTQFLMGPWSEPTDEVHMPADVAAYAMDVLPANPKSDVKVDFQVIKFDPNTGATLPHKFPAQAGEVIGELRTADIPSAEGTGKKTLPMDFTTRQIVLDADGGLQAMPSGLTGGALRRPALTLLLRPDGTVLAHKQADDVVDEVRKDIAQNYKHEIDDSNKKRQSSMGAGYGGMMRGMMGGMMGGYPGMMGGGGMR